MKELQNFVYRHMDALKHHKRYLAMLTALSMLVTFIVPLILVEPADSKTGALICSKTEHIHSEECYVNNVVTCGIEMHIHSENCYSNTLLLSDSGQVTGHLLTNVANNDGNIIEDKVYSRKNEDLYDLLFGVRTKDEWVDKSKSIEENLSIASAEYFLGFASDFCAFIEGDFKATEADAEGRVAVGGDIIFDNTWNYQIASGDYASMTPIGETGNYRGITGFASALVGGKMVRVNTLSTGYGRYRSNADVENFDDADEGHHTVNKGDKYSYAVFFEPEDGLFKRFVVGNVADSKHYDSETGTDKPYNVSCQHDYPGDCGESCEHTYLSNVNELSQIYEYPEVKNIITSVFSEVRSRSANLAQQKGISVTEGNVLDATGYENAEVIYFDLGNHWPGEFNYTNIPENAKIVVNCSANNINIGNTLTKINGVQISKRGDDLRTNNNEASERILYNFHNATELNINGNFNGTILAPNADIKSNDAVGHLSGALIAKSFEGKLEFGYRPYRGSADILGLTSGYFIPADKIVDKEYTNNGNKVNLPGAELVVEEYQLDENNDIQTDDEGKTILNKVFSWLSGNETQLIPFKSQIDYSGDTVYETTTTTTTGTAATTVKTTSTTAVDSSIILKTETSNVTEVVTQVVTKVVTEIIIDEQGIETAVTVTDNENKPVTEIVTEVVTDSNSEPVTVIVTETTVVTHTIVPETEKKLENIRLIFANDSPNKDIEVDVYQTGSETPTTIEVGFSNTALSNGQPYSDISLGNIENINAENISKIIIKPKLSEVRIAKYELTYAAEVDGLITEYPVNNTLKSNEVINIPFDSTKKLNSIELKLDKEQFKDNDWYRVNCTLLDSNNQTINSINFVDKNGNDDSVDWSKPFIINFEAKTGISKIQIKADASDTPISYYKITTLESVSEAPVVPDDTPEEIDYIQSFVRKYKISEQKAPEGFVKTDYYYDVTLTEEIDLDPESESVIQQGDKYFPTNVLTTLEIKKYEKIDGEFVANANANEKIKFRVKDTYHTSDDSVTVTYIDYRDIIVLDENDSEIDHFRMKMNYNSTTGVQSISGIYRVDVDNEDNETPIAESQDSSKLKAQIITSDDKKYYFNPDVMMIMPFPKNNLEFENIPGLLFKKVDDAGNAVDGAKITILPSLKDGTSEINSNSYFIEIENIVVDRVYTLSETQVPDNYIKADDIYFKKVETSNENSKVKYEIRYGSTGDIVNSDSGYQVLDLYNNNVIKMVDNRILGVKLSLDKFYKVGDTETDLGGSEFSLYANNGTLICSGLNGNGDVFENETFKTLNNVYVENGYLKPGVYYLTEDVVPTHPDNADKGDTFENPGKIYFTITSNFELKAGKAGGGIYNIDISKGKNQVFVKTLNGNEMNSENQDAINNVVKFEITGTFGDIYLAEGSAKIDIKGINKNGETYNFPEAEHTVPINLTKFELQKWDGDGVKIEALRIEDIFGNVYQYPKGDTKNPEYVDETGVLTENNSTLKIENKPDDGLVNIPVQKNWAGDAGFEKLRTESVEVKLYQSTEEISDYKELTDDMVYKFIQGEGEQATETEAKVTLNDANKWSYVFENLPSFYIPEEGTKKYPYYYYIKEETVPNGYEASYSTSGDGTMIVTNTLQVVNINAQKIWNCNDDYKNMIPESIVLKIQWNVGTEDKEIWEDISNKTITVKQSDDFKGVFKNLPAGYKYRIVEAYSPNGWYVSVPSAETVVNDNNTTFTITNAPKLGSFTIQKYWSNDSDATRPENIYLQLRRAVRKLWPEDQPFESVTNENGDIIEVGVSDDYARLLQYSLYFYDGNMCGDQVDENTAYTWRKDCHTTRDTTGDGEYTGGFHDAGDHVMFGLPAGYTASMLGWSMYEFPESFEELNQTAHMKIIEDYYCDFFMKCAKFDDDGNITAILYQKGNGTPDHAYWGMPEKQDEVMKTGAGTELYWTDDAELNGAEVGGDIASEYAAALTIAYLNYQQTYKYYDADAQKYDNYLAMAEKLFDFALANRNCVYGQNIEYVNGNETGGYYKSTSIDDDIKWAAVWLDIATDNQKYSDYLNDNKPNYGGLNISWNDVGSAAAIAYALHVDESKQEGIINSINSSITNEVKDAQGNVRRTAKTDYMFGNNSGGWGQMRHNAAYQTAVLIANKFNNTDTKAEWAKWCQNQMDVILGNNTSSGNDSRHLRTSTCYVTNFAENTLLHPHYRATSGMEVEMEAKNDPAVINGYDIDPYKLIGGLAGGWFNEGAENSFKDERLNYEETEVATDYNAGLVCAAAGLYDFYGTGHTYEIPGVKTQYLQLDPAIEAPEMMYVDDSINLNITGFDDVRIVTWEIITENGEEPKAEIANDGKLTAKETGLVKVKVSGDTVTGVTRSATAEIMVYEQASISVPNGTVEENGTYIMEANTVMQLTAENFEQDAEIEWSVTNTDGNSTYVASIDESGNLTANDAGTVIVKAESQYKRATIMVKVNAPVVDAQADSAPISNSSDQISVNTSDTDVVRSVLMSYAIRQTSVRVLADISLNSIGNINTKGATQVIVIDSSTIDSNTNKSLLAMINNSESIPVSSLLSGKNITKIKVSITPQYGNYGAFYLNDSVKLNNGPNVPANTTLNNNVLETNSDENGVIYGLDNTQVANNSITSMKFENWGKTASINLIEVTYEVAGISITNTEKEIVEGDTITLNSSGATGDVTWVLPDNTTEVEGTSYNYTAPDVNADTVVTFKAKDSGDTSKIPELTLTIKTFEIVDDNNTPINSIDISTGDIPYQLKTNGSTSGSYVWESDNQDIVINPSTGQITSASGGTATITVTRKDTQISDSITVNVVGSLTFNNPINKLYTGGDNVTYSVNESSTYSNITWEITENNNNAISIDPNTGEVTIQNAGSAKIKATARDNNSNVVAVSPEYSITVEQLQVNNANNTAVEVGSELDVSGWSLSSQPTGHNHYEYSSADEQYATCDGTKVTGVKSVDNVNIIVKSVDSNGKILATAAKQITVNNKPLEISVNKSTLVINETATLNYSGDDVEFEGYDNSVIKIENNTITGLKGGSTIITAKRISDNATKQISITVNGMSINTNGGSTSVDVGSELDISGWSINNQPYGHSQYVWSSADTQYATCDGTKVTGVKSVDNVNIIVQSVDSSGNVLATATQNIKVNKGSVVETPKGYELIHTNNQGKKLEKYVAFEKDSETNAIPNELKDTVIDYIIIKLSWTGDNPNYIGAIYYNGKENKFSGNDRTNEGAIQVPSDGIYCIPLDEGIVINSIKFDCWYNGSNATIDKIYFYSKIPEPEITTPEGTKYDGEYVVMYKGDTLNLATKNFHGNVNWSASTADVRVTGNGATAQITADNITNEVVIQATDGEETASIKVKVLPQPLIVELSHSEIRAGSKSTITVTAKGEEINKVDFTISPEGTGITIENNEIIVPADYSGESEVTITASKDGYASGESKLKIKPGLVVSPNGNIVMNVGDIKKFSAYNAIGDVTWENLTPEILSVSEKGYVTAKMFGTGKIQVKDDGTGDPIVIEINVQRVGVTVKLPEKSEIVGNYILTSDDLVNGSWQEAINNLPYINEYGDEYYYYIVETDENGNPVTSVQGGGVSYIPISYTNNGLTLNDVNGKTLSVRNAATEKPQGQLPSTGGSGVTTYYYLGGVIMLLSIAGFTGLKRRERKRRKE